MRDYSKISPRFWIGKTGKQIKEAGSDCTILALYLLSSPHSNMIGLYYIPLPLISHETGLTMQGVSKALQRLSEAQFCAYDQETEMVFVYEMAKYQIGASLSEKDKQVKGIQNQYDALPNNAFLMDLQ